MKKKIVYIAPHLSTGGLPQYLYKQMEMLTDAFDIYCIEWDNVTGGVLVVQRNRIQKLLGEKLITLSHDKHVLFDVLNRIQPDIVHLQEIPELFMQREIADKLYTLERKYVIVETSHDSSFDVSNKAYLPDKFFLISQYQINTYQTLGVPYELVEHPIEYKKRTKTREQALLELGLDPALKHVLNVGLFTPRKNQKEIIEYARQLQDQPIQFHFLGNHADNFRFYWEPLMQGFPKNCKWWNERTDVDSFYEAADLFLFTSRGHATDKETMPLVIREAIGWNVPSLIYNLPVYLDYFDKYANIKYLTEDMSANRKLILQTIGIQSPDEIFYTLNGEERLAELTYIGTPSDIVHAHGDGASQYFSTFVQKELENNVLTINAGDVFVDLGANIGMSAKYATLKGAEVHCVEPDPTMLERLQKNVPTAKVYPVALSSESKRLELYHWPYNHVIGGPTYTCDAVTLRQILQLVNKPINYMKVDIEGYEDTLFDSITSAHASNIEKLMVEHHNHATLDAFCNRLTKLGFEILHINRGHQAFIYARHTNFKGMSMKTQINYGFSARWDLDEQMMYYSCKTTVDFPIILSVKEYKSDAVLWAVDSETLHANIEYWIMPTRKETLIYKNDPHFSGVKFCIYNKETGEQLYEEPFFYRFVNIPTVSMSNYLPYRFNYLEFFVDKQYAKWIDKEYDLVVDVGANAGVFSEYMLRNGFAQNVVAVECDPIALKDLQRNFHRHPRAVVIPNALHHTNDFIKFNQFTRNPLNSTVLTQEQIARHGSGLVSDKTIELQTVTLRDIIAAYGTIDLLKMDIEGGEYNIIANTDDSVFTHINNLFIECHFMESDYMEKYRAMVQKLQRLGYTVEEDFPNQAEMAIEKNRASDSIYAYKGTV